NDNKNFIIKAVNNSAENIYIQQVRWNGKDYNKSYISFNDLIEGGTLEFVMGSEPSTSWGIK
ncbi:MAG: glycoside hydrolase domain-containing protein, partial [Bacteroides sp.]